MDSTQLSYTLIRLMQENFNEPFPKIKDLARYFQSLK